MPPLRTLSVYNLSHTLKAPAFPFGKAGAFAYKKTRTEEGDPLALVFTGKHFCMEGFYIARIFKRSILPSSVTEER